MEGQPAACDKLMINTLIIMASNFSSTSENTCEGDNCEAVTDVTYYVKEKKRLCKDCASKEGCILQARKGLPRLYCEKHPDKDVEMYCKKHDMALCHTCAVTDHWPCVLHDIAGAVDEIKAKLNGLKGKTKDKLRSCRAYENQLLQCRKDSDAHLQAVKDEVDLTIQEAIKLDQDREEEDAAKINQEIDEKNGKLQEKIQKLQEEIERTKDKIRENNEEREKRHEVNHTNAEKRREPMNDKQCQLHTDIQCRKDSDAHLQAVKDEVDLTIKEEIKLDKDREEEDATKINQEIDEKNGKLQEKIEKLQEEIRRMKDEILENNEKREKRHELNHTNAEKRREPMSYKQRLLHTDIQKFAQQIEKKIGELEKSWKDITKSTEYAILTLDTVLEDDKCVVTDGHHVNTLVADELDKPLDEDGVTRITQMVSGVRFLKGVGREKYNGRIDGYDGEWKLIDTINVGGNITLPRIVGCIDESKVIITDGAVGSMHTYMLDMNTKHTQVVITGSGASWVTSCALLDDEIVCGKGCRGDSLTGCISLFDRQWKLIHDVTISTNTTYDNTWVDVAADQNGMIIAAEWGKSKIYAINPADGKIVKTITYKENIVMFDVLSSGHIIALPSPRPDHRVFIIDRDGNESKGITHSDVIWNVCIDPMTDDLYVVTSDDEDKTCVIDQVMSRSDVMKRRVASFPLSTRLSNGRTHLLASRVMVTSSGKMIASDGDNIHRYSREPYNCGFEPGVIRLEEHGIEVRIPPEEAYSAKDVTVAVIDKVPPQLVLKKKEVIISVGLKLSPSHLQFNSPVKVTMRHSAIFSDTGKADIIVYTRRNDTESFSAIPCEASAVPRCVVRQRDLDLYIDHFSEWWIVAYIRWAFIGKRVICTPYVPVPTFRNAEYCLYLCTTDDNKGSPEEKDGYKKIHFGTTQFYVKWRHGDLTISYYNGAALKATKDFPEETFYYLTDHKEEFDLNTNNIVGNQLQIRYNLNQSIVKDIIFRIDIKDSCSDTRHQSSASGGDRPETIGRTASSASETDEVFEVMETVGQSGASRVAAQTSAEEQLVSDADILKLSKLLAPNLFYELHVALGIDYSIAEGVREKSTDVNTQYMHLLQKWKAKSLHTREDLDVILNKAGAGGLAKKYYSNP